MRWVLLLFVAAVAGLCLLCDEPATSRARRDSVELEVRRNKTHAALPGVTREADVEAEEAELEVEEEMGPPPEDPISEGDCSLFLSMTSAETGKSVHSRVKLFRLGVAGNEHWTAGDQLHVELDVPDDGLWIHKLPEGNYRIHAAGQRHPSDDPFRFSVRGAVTEKSFALPMPRVFRARLVVVDERGQPINAARRRRGSVTHHDRNVKVPWLRKRRLRHADAYWNMGGIGIGGGTGGSRGWKNVAAIDGAFDLGEFRENPRHRMNEYLWRFGILDRSEFRLKQGHEPGRDHTWMAISVKPRPVEDTIFFPDGRLAVNARVWIHADAVLVPSPAPPSFWRTLSVKVRVSLEGYEEMRFEYGPTKPLKKRYLQPVPAPSKG